MEGPAPEPLKKILNPPVKYLAETVCIVLDEMSEELNVSDSMASFGALGEMI